MSPRNICITAVDGNTGFAIAELILTHADFSKKVDSVTGLAVNLKTQKVQELQNMGATVVPHVPGRLDDMASSLELMNCDTICIVPPAHVDKYEICVELVEVAKQAGIGNVCLLSSAGCDYADPKKQPRLREFIDLETLVLQTKGDANTPTGGSPCVIRAGFYAENLLLYAPQAKEEGVLPLPIGDSHKFAPVALGDVAHVAAHVLTGKGPHGLDDKHRGQLMIVTGPMLCAGNELATAASQAMGVEMQFKNISQAEAKRVLKAQSESDQSELDYLLEYYSLVREGKTNYISTTAFHDVTGEHPTEPVDFFKMYAGDMKPNSNKRAKKSHP